MGDLFRCDDNELGEDKFKPVGYTEEDVRRLAEALSALMLVVGAEANSRGEISGELGARMYDGRFAGVPFLPLLKEARDG